LVDELGFFADALFSLSEKIFEIPLTEREAKNIMDEAAACLVFLEKFRDVINPYETAFAEERGSFSKIWRKICWGVYKQKEITKLREKLFQRKLNISLCQGSLGM